MLVIQYSCSTFGCFLIKIHQSFERTATEINERENIQDNFIHTLLIFTWKNSQELKLISNLCNKDYNSECLHLFSIWKSLRIPCIIFQRYHLGLLHYKIPVDISFFSHVLKPDKLEGSFQRRNLGNYSYFLMNIVRTLFRYLHILNI